MYSDMAKLTVSESEVIFFSVVPAKQTVHHMTDVYGSVPRPVLNSLVHKVGQIVPSSFFVTHE